MTDNVAERLTNFALRLAYAQQNYSRPKYER
jgi:hypothetical protein